MSDGSAFIGGVCHALRAGFFALLVVFASLPAQAADYYNQKWFDFPDVGTLPKLTAAGCGKNACTKVPEFRGIQVTFRMQCKCINPLFKTELLRRDVRIIVSGPDTANQAVQKALVGYATGCVVTAIAASTAGPQVVASPGGFFAAFEGCISGLSAAGVAGGLINQLHVRLDTSQTHWSPL